MCTVSGFAMVWLDTVSQEVLKWVSVSLLFFLTFLCHCVDAFLGRLTCGLMAFGYVASTSLHWIM